jgi:heat shock protein HtpX
MTTSEIIQNELKVNKFAEEYFQKHQENHPDSPNLYKMVDELYKTSGLNRHKTEIFDYGESDFTSLNAGFVRKLGKPMILISSKLLELFPDHEEKAILAHEFAHAAARHHRTTLPLDILNNVAKTSASLAIIGEAMSSGGLSIAISATAALAVGVGIKMKLPKQKKLALASVAVTGLGVLSAFNPAILTALAVRQAVSISASFIDKSFSRTKEYQADKGAVTLGANPLSLMTALRKMQAYKEQKLKSYPEPIQKLLNNPFVKTLNKLFATHPPTEKRIKRLTNIAIENGYSQEAIHQAAKGELESLNKRDHNIRDNTILDLSYRFLGRKNPIQDEYNNACKALKTQYKKIETCIPPLSTLRI